MPAPADSPDFSQAISQLDDVATNGHPDSSYLAGAVSGVATFIDSYMNSKASAEKKEHLAQALQSGDPMAIANAGQPELAKTIMGIQAEKEKLQSQQQFTSNESALDRGMRSREFDTSNALKKQELQQDYGLKQQGFGLQERKMGQDYQIAMQEALAKQQASQQKAVQDEKKEQQDAYEKMIAGLGLGPMSNIIVRNNMKLLDDPNNFERTRFSVGKTGVKKSAIKNLEKEKELQNATFRVKK
jgi:hypothetical protein